MKKLLFTALIAVSLISSAFAEPVKKVGVLVRSSFENNYPRVTNVAWELGKDYATATFVVDNIRTQAFYSLNGDFIGSSRAISIDDLPAGVKRTFAKKYADYTVNEAIQFDTDEETAYCISAENEKQTVILKVARGTIEVIRTSNKK